MKNKKKSISNVEYVEHSSDDEISFDDLKAMYDKEIYNIEPIKETKPNNQENASEEITKSFVILMINPSNDHTIWTFDTGASEYITNNKDILTEFREEKITIVKIFNATIHSD
ncbi:hypothetical protein BCR32DRAFT_286987 [Anaeromyces robustus]|uniref:Uncharacterized protein n=1 Tax=Anaeromyces robustus TaxID=1754192 RepID=A0A1Y1VTK1_9FUNG|nr:hypothetical protein BCR32DRAFT_286987 [Anaeromyces robustus]|eukprot:ORX64617.1 hypothetical protein BCR32DRAFT_286987 [Anaeromyces robustus]